MGKGGWGHLLPGNVVKCFFVLQMLSKVSVDEVFMRYFEKMSSASRIKPTGQLGTSDLSYLLSDFM